MKSRRQQNGELQARRSTHFRRNPVEPNGTPLIVGALCLNRRTCNLLVNDKAVLLTPVEFELLYYLMSRAGEVLSAEQLLCQVWQYPPGSGRSELIRAHIKNLRMKIEQDSKEPVYLKTIGRRGYTICESAPAEA